MDETKKLRLKNLIIDRVGLVRKGANKKPFFFVKSVTGQPESREEPMSDEQLKEQLDAILEKLTPGDDEAEVQFSDDENKMLKEMLESFSEDQETFAGLSDDDKKTVRAFLASMGGKLGGRLTAMLGQMAGGSSTPPEKEESNDDEADKFAEMATKLREEFTTQLEAEQAKTAKFAERFEAEQTKRRLMEFTDQARTFDNVPVGVEQFGEDLMVFADSVDDEVYSRLVQTLRAMDKQIEKGALFDEFASRSRGDDSASPFEAKMRPIQAKLMKADVAMSNDEAYAEAMTIAADRYPDLARDFDRSLSGGG